MGLALEPLQRSKAYVQSDRETEYKRKQSEKKEQNQERLFHRFEIVIPRE